MVRWAQTYLLSCLNGVKCRSGKKDAVTSIPAASFIAETQAELPWCVQYSSILLEAPGVPSQWLVDNKLLVGVFTVICGSARPRWRGRANQAVLLSVQVFFLLGQARLKIIPWLHERGLCLEGVERGGRRMFRSWWILLEALVYYHSSEWECMTEIFFLFSWGTISALWIKGYIFNQKTATETQLWGCEWCFVLRRVKGTVQQCYSTWSLRDKSLQIHTFL